MKKLLSVVLCLAIVMALASSAFAAGLPLKPAPGTGGEIVKPGGATEIRPGTGDNAETPDTGAENDTADTPAGGNGAENDTADTPAGGNGAENDTSDTIDKPSTDDTAGGKGDVDKPAGGTFPINPGAGSGAETPDTPAGGNGAETPDTPAGGNDAETPDTPATPEKIILDFVDASLYNQESETKASWAENGIKLTMEKIYQTASGATIQKPSHKDTYKDHTRLQKGNTVTIEYPNMKTIQFKFPRASDLRNFADSIADIPGITKVKDETNFTLTLTFSEPVSSFVVDFICYAIVRLSSVEILETFAEGDQGTPIQGNKTLTIGDKTYTTKQGRWIYNQKLDNNNNFMYDLAIFDKTYQVPDDFAAYGTTIILVVNKYGEFVRMYHLNNRYDETGVQEKYVDTAAKEKQYLKALAELQDGELLIICANAGNYANAESFDVFSTLKDTYADYLGKVVELTGFEWEKKEEAPAEAKTITIGEKTYTTAPGAWLYNEAVTAATTANYEMIIFDKNYTGEVTTNGYGCVLVLNKYGELIKIYDGANGGFWTEAGKAATTQFTTATFASVAWSELGEGETMIIFPNKGSSALSVSRTWALGLRTAGVFNLVAELTGFTWEVRQPAGGDDVVDPPVDPNPDTPVDPNPDTPVDPNPDTPVDPNPDTPVDPNPDTPVDPNPDTPVDPNPDTPVDPNPETPPTGDYTVVFFAMLVLSMTALVVLVSKKRAF